MVKIDRIGLAVGNGALRAIGLRRGAVVWTAMAPFADVGELERIAGELLAEAPRPPWRIGAVLAVGPARSQTRRISGLPPVRDARTVTTLVRESIGRFFLRNGIPFVSSDAVRGMDDSWWVTAFEEPLVTAVTNACRQARIRLEAVQPTIVIVPAALGLVDLVWQDDATLTSARFDGGRLAEVCRRPEGLATPLPSLPATLAAMGEQGASFADAYAAAIDAGRSHSSALRPRARDTESPPPKWRLVAAIGACAVAGAAALAAPALGAYARAIHTERQAVALEPAARQAMGFERELLRFQAALRELDDLAASASLPHVRLLAALGGALPPDAALTALRIDTSGGQLGVLAPRIAALLDRLERSPLISAPQIVGPITRERSGDRERERATIKFVLR